MCGLPFFPVAALNAGLVGLALVYAISLTDLFQFCVRVSAEIENLVSYHSQSSVCVLELVVVTSICSVQFPQCVISPQLL